MSDFIVGVPCSDLKMDSAVPCTREDEAVALAVGAWLCGKKPTVFMQNAGLGNCIDTITSLVKPYDIGIKFIIANRTTPEHHAFMGKITPELLKMLGINATIRSC
jgi:sulfopyruvate decarboxylase subunit alpha